MGGKKNLIDASLYAGFLVLFTTVVFQTTGYGEETFVMKATIKGVWVARVCVLTIRTTLPDICVCVLQQTLLRGPLIVATM